MQIKWLTGFLILLVGIMACEKKVGFKGADGLQSLIDVQEYKVNSSCPTGGVTIKTGLDKNRNNVLDSVEVTNTKYICNGLNGQNGGNDKQIALKINKPEGGYGDVTGTDERVLGELIKFSKANYLGVDSIIFVAKPYLDFGTPSNSVTVKLYNVTDKVEIANSTLISNASFNNSKYLQTGNLFQSLPDKEITLGISVKSTGPLASAGDCYVFLYRK